VAQYNLLATTEPTVEPDQPPPSQAPSSSQNQQPKTISIQQPQPQISSRQVPPQQPVQLVPPQTQQLEDPKPADDVHFYTEIDDIISQKFLAVVSPTTAELAQRAVAMQVLAEKFDLQKLDPHSVTKKFSDPQILIVGVHAMGVAVRGDPSPPQLLILLDDEISLQDENTFFMEMELYLGSGSVIRHPDFVGGDLIIPAQAPQPSITVRLMFGWRNPPVHPIRLSNPIEHLQFVNWSFSNLFNLSPAVVEVARLLRYLQGQGFSGISKCDDFSIMMMTYTGFKTLLHDLTPAQISSGRLFVQVFRQIAGGALLPLTFFNSIINGFTFSEIGRQMKLEDRVEVTMRAAQLLGAMEDRQSFILLMKKYMSSI
jgi:hypothetical protein